MDFQSLTRKDLQTLCKKNMIPANITNVAMAEALAALREVAGIEEFLNPIESESQQSEEIIDIGTPGNCRTACRTSTRRKPVKEPPTTQSIIRTRRGRVGEMADQQNKDLNISSTPSFPSNRRRAPVPSARKKLETHSIEEKEEEKDQSNGDQKRSDVLETPSMPKTQGKVSVLGSTRRKTEARMDKSSVQGACSTRRSMRLLEKNMEKLSLMECGSVEPVVADKLFDELPERKEFCEQKINEIDSKLNVFSIGGNAFEEDDSKEALGLDIDGSDDPEGMTETKDKEEEQANDGKDGKESKEKVQMEDENEEDNTITSEDPEGMTETKDKEEEQANDGKDCKESKAKVQMEDENEEDNTITDKEPEDKIQSEAAIEEQHAFTPSCNDEFSTENFSKEKDLSAQSPLLREKADLDITAQHEVLKENSKIINEETVEFNIEDLVDINVEEAEFQNVNAQDSISEPKMEVQDGGSSFKDMVEFDFGELIDVDVMESELVENFDCKDSVPGPKIEDLSKSDEILVVNQELPQEEDSSFKPFAGDQIPGQFPRPTAEVPVKESRTSLEIFISADQGRPKIEDLSKSDEILVVNQELPHEEDSEVIDNSSFTPFEVPVKESRTSLEIFISADQGRPKIEDLSKSDEILVVNQELPHEEDSEVIDNSSFTPFAVDQIPGQFPRPMAEVPVKESRTSLEIFNSADQGEDMKNDSNDDEERNLSLRQLRKKIKELHLSKKSSKEKTYGKEQVEKVVRTALQPLSENCLAKDGQEKTTTANSMFI